MIPKIIHYCWFGGNMIPEDVINYIETWKKIMPDYEIIKWSEDNFDVMKHHYTREAYKAKKYAFVSDYCRLFVLREFGGIYLDTDVEILKSLDLFLNHKVFMGFEGNRLVGTAVIGSCKNAVFINEIIDLYDTIRFKLSDNKYDLTPNVIIITDYLNSKNIITKEGINNYDDKLTIYPRDYFSPKHFDTRKMTVTDNTHTIHHYSQSWTSLSHKIIQKIKFILIFIMGFKRARKMIDTINKITNNE